MRLTKFEHAFVTIEVEGATLVVDPGKFTASLPRLHNVVGVVLTHEHDDHTWGEHVASIRSQFGAVPVWGTAGAQAALATSGIDATVALPGDAVTVGPFDLEFYGGAHAIIHRTIPQIENLGVAVNSRFFYSGDSLVEPGQPVEVLAVPSSAPWLKASEMMDFVDAVRPRVSFATHDSLWTAPGAAMANARIASATQAHGGRFVPLGIGESFEI